MNCTSLWRAQGGIGARTLAIAAVAAFIVLPAFAQVSVTGGGNATLQDLVGSPTMVTIVLKNSNAEDPNLHVVEVDDNLLITKSQDGTRNVYLLDNIKEVRVQGEVVQAPRSQVKVSRALSMSDRSVVERAMARTLEVYQGSAENQGLKMMAAGLLAGNENVAGDIVAVSSATASGGDVLKSIEEAHSYLVELASSNDPSTALLASMHLYFAGDFENAKKAIGPAMGGSSRQARILAAEIAGLIGDRSVEDRLLSMVRDRSADVSAPAAVALARLGNREIIPILLDMLGDINTQKGDAAITGLSMLGGEDIVEQMKLMLKNAQTVPRFRMAMVLFKLHDPTGEQLLAREFLKVSSLARESALVLAARGNARGIEYLRARLDERMDEVAENYMFRASAAGALIMGDNRWAVSVIQETLRTNMPQVEAHSCYVVAFVGTRSLLSVVHPSIESTNPVVALMAASAAFSIVNPDYHERFVNAGPDALTDTNFGQRGGGIGAG